MDTRQTLLIARYSARYSVRGGVGLVFLLLSLTFGLLVSHTMLQGVEAGAQQIEKNARETTPEQARGQALTMITRFAREPIAWMLSPSSTGDAEVDGAAREQAEDWTSYLLDDRPALLSAIFLILLFGWPFIVVFGAFDLYAGDINSRQLRYQLLRADRGSIFFGRLLGTLVTFGIVLVLLGATTTTYMAIKLPVYDVAEMVAWSIYGTLALAIATLPYVALCSWISASIGSSFASLSVVSAIVGGVPLLATLARNSLAEAEYVRWVLPWGFQTRLFHHEPSQVTLAVAGCAVQTALFGWLGYRKFTRRDL